MANHAVGKDAAVGQMLGHYCIVEKIGAGGMGEVYRARDTRLDRTVAVKILPSQIRRSVLLGLGNALLYMILQGLSRKPF